MADLVLEVVEGGLAGRQVPLESVVDIGREPSLPLPLDADGQVSRRHARVTVQNGQATVEDLGSTNGTFVNDQPIHSPRTLRPGDRIRIGLTVIELRSQAQVRERASAVQARPDITAVDNAVFAPAAENELSTVPPEPVAPGVPPPPPPEQPQRAAPGLRAPQTPAAFVPPEVVG